MSYTTDDLLAFIDSAEPGRVAILGDLILDKYTRGAIERISPEAPVPVLLASEDYNRLGGALNVAANGVSLGLQVDAVGLVGDDEEAQALHCALRQHGISGPGIVTDPGRPTTTKTRLVSNNQQVIRIDRESNRPPSDEVRDTLLERLDTVLASADLLVVSDYAKGVVTPEVCRHAIEKAAELDIPVLVDPKGIDYGKYRGATLMTPNRGEAEAALGARFNDISDVQRGARELTEAFDLSACLITLGPKGMYLYERDGGGVHIPTEARSVFDVTGAGDTVLAAMAYAVSGKAPLELAARLANKAAGIAVSRAGAVTVTTDELREILGHGRSRLGGKVVTKAELLDIRRTLKRAGATLVFTNGCFDILHAGHLDYLTFCREQGDALVIGLNSDVSVRRIKGETRPIISQEHRATMLAALAVVDYVVTFDDETPAELIGEVLPDVLVKGEDWSHFVAGREAVEAAGGKVVLAKLVPGLSTTSIIDRIRSLPED